MATKATRQSFGEAVAKLGETNPNIVVLDADLSKSTMTGEFAKKFPDRHFEFGIAEENMIGAAAGLAMAGKVPFATSFACFLAGRTETIRMSVAYSNAAVKLVGTHVGVGIGEDGNSQMGLEDIAYLRSFPNMAIVQPADDLETQQAIAWAAAHPGAVYFRLTRQKVQDVHGEGYRFQFGKGDVLKKPQDPNAKSLVVFATGGVVYNSLKALEELEKESGLASTLVNIHTIKPLDEELVLSLARKAGKVITVEDHSVTGGLGSAVSEVLSGAGLPVKLLRLGVKSWGVSGHPDELYDLFGFSSPKLKQSFKNFSQTA